MQAALKHFATRRAATPEPGYSRAEHLFRFKVNTPLDEGLRETVDWFWRPSPPLRVITQGSAILNGVLETSDE